MSMNDASEEFATELEKTTGDPVWVVIAGRGTGSMVSIDGGEKRRRRRAIKNPHLAPVAREFEGEWTLYIEHAAWRLDGPGGPLCDSDSDNGPLGEMVCGLNQMIGAHVRSAEYTVPGGLVVTFSNGLRLSVSAERVTEGDGFSFLSGSLFIPRMGREGCGGLSVRRNDEARNQKNEGMTKWRAEC